MNSGSGAGASGSSLAAGRIVRDEGVHERRGEAAAALWLALAERVHAAPTQAPLAEIEPPNAWRGSAGDLTPRASATGTSGEAPADANAPERLTLRVDGGHMGEVSLTLEREDGALRVVIGLENERFVGDLAPDARALRSALEAAGLSVHSLNIVPRAELGTVLAQRRLSQTGQKAPGDPQGSQPQEAQAQKRNQKRLQLIG